MVERLGYMLQLLFDSSSLLKTSQISAHADMQTSYHTTFTSLLLHKRLEHDMMTRVSSMRRYNNILFSLFIFLLYEGIRGCTVLRTKFWGLSAAYAVLISVPLMELEGPFKEKSKALSNIRNQACTHGMF